ncbi:hypothetical protein [Streptomyces sp. SPB074]|uniref:hypothetical protein n=1 Tax=Streptomyces sp. (strain SPB074) TaxID=465543 RepID=UPI00017F1CD3|nr:hypothetical protein [Streptomyces sp. SPB074]
MEQDILIDDSAQARVVTCILHWPHSSGFDAHCLARLIYPDLSGQPTAVLSEIASNPDALGITGDFASAATAFLDVVRPYMTLDPEQVQWFAHHGLFSSYDPTGAETLTEVTMPFDGNRYHSDLRGHRLLTPEEAAQALVRWQMVPIPDSLARLGHFD